jgi:hypothetical protein
MVDPLFPLFAVVACLFESVKRAIVAGADEFC